MNACAQTYSNYKSPNTIKCLISITPSGGISFLSASWGGKASDKLITLNSGFLDILSPGDCVLADREFLVEEKLATVGAVLRISAFTRGKKQFTGRDVDISTQIAHVCIHVERVIGRFKKFKITSSVIPISQVDLLNEMMVTVCGLTNLSILKTFIRCSRRDLNVFCMFNLGRVSTGKRLSKYTFFSKEPDNFGTDSMFLFFSGFQAHLSLLCSCDNCQLSKRR